jgi:hypothetical protein
VDSCCQSLRIRWAASDKALLAKFLTRTQGNTRKRVFPTRMVKKLKCIEKAWFPVS